VTTERGLYEYRYNRTTDRTYIAFYDEAGNFRDKYAYKLGNTSGYLTVNMQRGVVRFSMFETE